MSYMDTVRQIKNLPLESLDPCLPILKYEDMIYPYQENTKFSSINDYHKKHMYNYESIFLPFAEEIIE